MSRFGAMDRQAKLRQETLAEYGLYQPRVDQRVSQVELAERLGVTQPAVSKIEHVDDMRISTLTAYLHQLQALGHQVTLTAAA